MPSRKFFAPLVVTKLLAIVFVALLFSSTTVNAQLLGINVINTSKISPALSQSLQTTQSLTADVIVQLNAAPSLQLNLFLQLGGVVVKGRFTNLNMLAVELPIGLLGQLAAFPEVSYISANLPVVSHGHITRTTGTDAVRTEGNQTFNGTGIGIAVIDS